MFKDIKKIGHTQGAKKKYVFLMVHLLLQTKRTNIKLGGSVYNGRGIYISNSGENKRSLKESQEGCKSKGRLIPN